MKAKLMAVCLVLIMALVLAGCDWLDAGSLSGPGASWLIVNPGLQATAQAGALRWQIQQTANAK